LVPVWVLAIFASSRLSSLLGDILTILSVVALPWEAGAVGLVFAMAILPVIDMVWVAATASITTGDSFSDFVTLDTQSVGQIIAAVIPGPIWIAYILRLETRGEHVRQIGA
jgi:hypothetical protein